MTPVVVSLLPPASPIGPSDSEVRDDRFSPGQQDVLGLDVAMDHALPVRILERAPDFACDAKRVPDR